MKKHDNIGPEVPLEEPRHGQQPPAFYLCSRPNVHRSGVKTTRGLLAALSANTKAQLLLWFHADGSLGLRLKLIKEQANSIAPR
jgi:hypothetical protein